MSGLGSKPCSLRDAGERGFTLLELMVVVTLVALVTSGVAFAVRDTQSNQLEREGQRLAAVLEVARAQSRASGSPVYWRHDALGFDIVTDKATRREWLVAGTVVEGPAIIALGPEPIIEPHDFVLAAAGSRVRLATDGLRPFGVRQESAGNASATTP